MAALLAVCLGGWACVGSAELEEQSPAPLGTVRIGVPEGQTESGDVGFQQFWRPFALEALTAVREDTFPARRRLAHITSAGFPTRVREEANHR